MGTPSLQIADDVLPPATALRFAMLLPCSQELPTSADHSVIDGVWLRRFSNVNDTFAIWAQGHYLGTSWLTQDLETL